MGVSVVTLGLLIFENKSHSRNVLETLNDRELLKRCRMDCERIEVVFQLVRDAITFPNQLKQSNNAVVKLFGNTPVFGYGENAALHPGLVLPGDLKWFRNYPTTSVFGVAHSHGISEVCVLTQIYWHYPPGRSHRSPYWSSTTVRYGYF